MIIAIRVNPYESDNLLADSYYYYLVCYKVIVTNKIRNSAKLTC